jgi:integrase
MKKEKKKGITTEDIIKMVSRSSNERINLTATLGLYTGAKPEELLALKDEDVTSEHVSINKRIKKEIDGGKTIEKIKERKVPVPSFVKLDSIKFKEVKKKEKEYLGKDYNENKLLIPTEKGELYDIKDFYKEWIEECKRLGIESTDFIFLRKAYAEYLIKKINIKYVLKYLGYNSQKKMKDDLGI